MAFHHGHQHVNMVRHNAPLQQAIAFAMVLLQLRLNLVRTFGPPQDALPVARVLVFADLAVELRLGWPAVDSFVLELGYPPLDALVSEVVLVHLVEEQAADLVPADPLRSFTMTPSQ